MKNRNILLALVITLFFVGCGKDKAIEQPADEPVETEGVVEEVADDVPGDSMVEEEVEDFITEQYSEDGSYEIKYGEEDEGYIYEYSYHLPKINDNSSDADTINDEIYNIAKNSIQLVEEVTSGSAEFPSEPEYKSVSYETYENGDIVSIVIISDAVYSDWIDYGVFNYNKQTHKKVSNEEILEIAGLSEDEFLKKARNTLGVAALGDLDPFLGEIDNEDEEDSSWRRGIIADYIQCYMYTISDSNINMDMMMFLDRDNELSICGLVHVPAGAGQYYSLKKLSDESVESSLDKYREYYEKFHSDEFEKRCLGLYDVEGYSATIKHKVSDGNDYEDEVYIGFDDSNPSVFLMQFNGDGYNMNYSGSLKWYDVNESGLAFEYELTELDFKKLPADEVKTGRFYLKPYDSFNESTGEYTVGAIYNYIDGIDMFDSNGEEILLNKSFG